MQRRPSPHCEALVALVAAFACTASQPPRPDTAADSSAAALAAEANVALAPIAAPEPGKSSVRVVGCAAKPMAPEEAERRPPETRAFVPDRLGIEAVHGGVLIEHRVQHACCLTAAVDAQVREQVVTVQEVLSGKPCRCMCGSTLRTVVGLSPGSYSVHVRLDNVGRMQELPEKVVTVGP